MSLKRLPQQQAYKFKTSRLILAMLIKFVQKHLTLTRQKPTLMFTSRNSAPIEWTCSLTASRVSNARTMAPIFRAVPIADNPATPPPITRILAGGTLPAAVICPVTYRDMYHHHLVHNSSTAFCMMQLLISSQNMVYRPPTFLQLSMPGACNRITSAVHPTSLLFIFQNEAGISNIILY